MSAYSSAVLADTPVAYWRCEDNAASTTMTDSSGNGHNATLLANSSSFTSTSNPITTDTSNHSFDVTTIPALGSCAIDLSSFSHITLEFWLYWTSFTNNDSLAFEYGPVYAPNSGFIVDPNSSAAANFLFGMGGSSAVSWVDKFTRPSANAWHHYVLDMDRANLTAPVNLAYVDGVAQTLTTVTHNTLTGANYGNQTLFMGNRNNASLGAPSNSKFDEIAIYGSGLSQTRVTAHYNAATIASGPANVKTVAGTTKSNVKTVAGLPLGSVKTVAGLG